MIKRLVSILFISIYSLFIGALLFGNKIALAQPPTSPPGGNPAGSPPTVPPGGNPAGSPCFDPVCIPIDGGTIFLLVAGLLLGIRMIYSFKMKNG